MEHKKIIPLEDRIPKLKEQRRKKTNRRFILYITIFFILILVIVYFQSPLSRIDHININGNHFTSKDLIVKKTELASHPHYWDVSTKKIKALVESIPTIKSAKVSKSFPNTITIQITEVQRVAYLDKNGIFYPVMQNGSLRKALNGKELPVNAPILMNWNDKPGLSLMANQLSHTPPAILHAISEIHLSANDPSNDTLVLYMNNGLKVIANVSSFSVNMKAYPEIAAKLKPGTKGTVHLQVGAYFEPAKSASKKSGTNG